MNNFGKSSCLNSVQNFDQNSRQNSDKNLNNNSGKILAKFWQKPWVTVRPEFYSGHNSSKNLNQNFNRIATIIWDATPDENIRPEIKSKKIVVEIPAKVSVRIQGKILVRILGYTDKLPTEFHHYSVQNSGQNSSSNPEKKFWA